MSGKLQQQQDNGDLKGLKIPRGVISANHAQFQGVKRVLSIFLKSLDGKVNASKSKFYGWNWLPGTMARISRILGFEGLTIWNSFNYLGIPIFKGREKMADWHSVIDKEKKINSWGTRWLNPVWKLVLIKAVLFSFLIYVRSISLAPKQIIQERNREIQKFLWQGGKATNTKKKIYLIN